jgi:hypothetical protein
MNLICCGQAANGTRFKGRLTNISCLYSSPSLYKIQCELGENSRLKAGSQTSGTENVYIRLWQPCWWHEAWQPVRPLQSPLLLSMFVKSNRRRHTKTAGIQTLYQERRALEYVATLATLIFASPSLSESHYDTARPNILWHKHLLLNNEHSTNVSWRIEQLQCSWWWLWDYWIIGDWSWAPVEFTLRQEFL